MGQCQRLLLPPAGAEGGPDVHHLQLYRPAAPELIDLQIKCRVHPVARMAPAALGHGGEEYAVELGAALAQPQLQVPVLAHVLGPQQRGAQQAEQRSGVAVAIGLQHGQGLQFLQRHRRFRRQRMSGRHHRTERTGLDHHHLQSLHRLGIHKAEVHRAVAYPLLNTGIIPLMQHDLHVGMLLPEGEDHLGQPVGRYAGHRADADNAGLQAADLIGAAAHGIILPHGALHRRVQPLPLRRQPDAVPGAVQ